MTVTADTLATPIVAIRRRGLAAMLTHGGAADGVREEIGASWRRSFDAGLRPERHDPPYNGDVDPDEALLRAACPVLTELSADLAETPVAVILSSAGGMIIDRRVSDEGLRARLDSVLLAPGFIYTEEAVGTNGIGTALVERKPVLVNGDEHFADALTSAACAAAPIPDPKSGRIRGVLTLFCSTTDASDLMLPLVIRAVRQIEDRLLDHSDAADRLLLSRFLQERRAAKGPVALVTARGVVANAAADRLLGPADEPMLRECASRLRRRPAGESMAVVLNSGTAVTVHADVAVDGAQPDGTLLRLTPQAGDASPTRDRQRMLPRYGWDSLTDTERSVAELVAEGLTNREAAERLFLSRHTVGFHLRSVFRKLDLSSRVELARIMVERRAS